MNSTLCWDYTDDGVVVKNGDDVVCQFATSFPSRDGLRVIDAVREVSGNCRVQVSDHGAGRKSVQVFRDDGVLTADVNICHA